MRDNTYNGWTNYETWAVALWIDNDYSSYRYWQEQARRQHSEATSSELVSKGTYTIAESARHALAAQLKVEITDASPLTDATLYADLLSAAFDEVDWYEIAEHFLGDLVEPEAQSANTAE